ncbi:MAG: TolC family protein, partial [Anaerotignum sp.]
MKKLLRSTKGALALALTVTLFGTTAFAEEPVATLEVGESETVVETLPVLTYEDALAKAKKNSFDLLEIQKTSEFLQETKGDIWDAVGTFTTPTYDYQKWVNDAVYSYTSAIYSTDSGMTKNKYAQGITNLALEATLKSTFSSLVETEESLALLEQVSDVEKIKYEQGQKKYELGMISKYSLDQLKASYETSKTNIYQVERSLEQMYISLNDMIGEDVDARFIIEYDTPFEPYELNVSIETYINAELKKDYSILLQEQAVEDAKFTMNYLPESTTNAGNKSNKNTYETEQRALKSAKA